MIFGNKDFISRYNFLDKNILECFSYEFKNNLMDFDKGSHIIDGNDIFVNIVEYETKTRKERFWEAHRQYIDLHLMLSGTEIIDLNFIGNMNLKDYIEKDDFLQMDGTSNSSIILNDGDFLICYPEDAHMTAIKENNSSVIKKAIFKIKLK